MWCILFFCNFESVHECTQVENWKIKIKIKSYLHALFLEEKKKPENQKTVFVWPHKFLACLDEVQEELLHCPPASALASASTFMLKFFKTSYFPNCTMDLVHIWCDDRYRSKVSFSNTPAHAYDLRVKVIDFEILQIKYYIKVFKELIFSKSYDGFGS